MQRATCTGIRIRSPSDARVIFHAVVLNVLPMVTRRLDTEERSHIQPGSVYVWEERGPHAELTGVYDGGRHEYERASDLKTVLIKQTYTVFVDTPRGQRKWHLIAYFTEESLDRLLSIDDIPQLANIRVPPGKYKSARSAKGRPDHIFNPDVEQQNTGYTQLEYVSYSTPSRRHSPTPLSDTSPGRTLTWVDVSPMQDTGNPPRRGSPGSLASSDELPDSSLAPLAYLQNCPPPRRHPVDEKTLMLFTASGCL
ncbi:hypothetical protein NMY22_g11238 [Coprinellus aureogranulatus]|nr:hypothetical protein NMY22_g11238 [Coprinellus aureogranulatus]